MRNASQKVEALQADIHRRLTGTERLLLAIEASVLARELARARLRAAHPEWDDAQLDRELLRLALLPLPLPPGLR